MKITNSITRTISRQALVTRKHSPHIMFVGGVVGVVTSGVLACRATLKLHEKLDNFKAELEETKAEYYSPQFLTHRERTLVDHRKELTYVYIKNTAILAKLYGPAVVVGTVSVGLLTGSHVTLAKRNTALAAAYTGLSEGLSAYRERVRGEVGEEKEQQLYSGVEIVKLKDGGSEIKITDPAHKLSPYARWFDQSNPNWQKNAEMNRWYIGIQQTQLNDRLKARGHVFLNEVYDELGLSHTQEGAVVGWIYPPRPGCDGFIDCGVYATGNADFHFGGEHQILLDFNVDGLIWDQI